MKFPTFLRSWPVCLFLAAFAISAPAAQAQFGGGLSPTLVTFSNTTVGTTSAAKTVTLSNSGLSALKLTSISVSGAFTETNNCGTSVAARSSCAISVSFKPTAAGLQIGVLSVRESGGLFGGSQSAILEGTGVAVTLTSISVSPASPSVTKGSQLQFTATGTYSNGTTANVTSSATWTSSTTSVATVSSTTKGLATAVAAGTSTISASVGTVKGSTVLTVPAATLQSITVAPNGVSLGLNGTQQFTATGLYSDGSTQNLTNAVTWTSGTPATVSVGGTGLATVLLANNTAVAITATSGSIVSAPAFVSALSTLPIVCASPTIDMKLLVITDGQTEADFPAITQILNYVGTPYTVLDFSTQTAGVTASMLSDGSCHGYYQGVIFTTGGYIYTLPGMATLTSYEQTFGVRQVNWYTDPTPDFGLNFTSVTTSSATGYSASFTTAAAPIFSYANTATPLSIANAFIYLTTPVASTSLPTGASVTPLITDAFGNTLSAIYTIGDGRQYLTQTFDSNQYLTHDLVLAYGLLNWVTKGIFLGQYHVYAAAQVDDFFINDSEWIPGTPCTDPITHDRTPPDASSLPVFRVTYTDMASLVTWQSTKQKDPLLSSFKLTIAFNGVGTAGNPDWTGLATTGTASDTLLSNLSKYQQYFNWISHTYDHPETLNGLCQSTPTGTGCADAADSPAVDDIDLEVLTNLWVAKATGGVNLDTDASDSALKQLTFTSFNAANMVTPGVTGLNDTEVPVYLYNDGIRNVVTDTSVIGQPNNGPNPSPNVGIVNSYEPGIYEVPRHPNDVFYNVANWADDQAEFSCIYNNPVDPPFNTYNAAQILDFVSTSFVVNMLMGDIDPEMFHQPDLHFSNNATNLGLTGTHNSSLISDTYDQTFSKYEALYKLPVVSPTLDQMAAAMQARNAYNLSGATASLVGFGGPTPQITISAPSGAASIPVTGLNSSGAESYGGQFISHIALGAGQTTTLPVPAATVVNLSAYYNVDGIATAGTAPISGGFDADGYAFNSSLLGALSTYQNLVFPLGPANAPDAVSSATVPVAAGQYGKLYLLGAAVNGAQLNQSVVVTYTDGTTSTFTQNFSDWAIPANYAGESLVTATTSRVGPGGVTNATPVNVYGYTFALTAGKTPASVKLPSNRNVVLVGIGWGN